MSHWEPLVWKRVKLWSPKSIPTLYSEPRIFVLKTQKDWSTRTKIIAQKQCVYRQTDRQWKTQNKVWVRFMGFNVTFNNISVISWRLILLVEETGVSGENHRPAVSHWQTLSHNVVLSKPRLSGIRTHNFSGNCSYKPNYYTTTTASTKQTKNCSHKMKMIAYLDRVPLKNYISVYIFYIKSVQYQ